MRVLLAILLLLFVGCTTQMGDLKGKIDEQEYEFEYNRTVDAVRSHYFVNKAKYITSKIPCVRGLTIGGSYVVGANFWGTLVGVMSGSGYSKKCVMSEDALKNYGVEAILHEYLHHIDSYSRKNNEGLINLDEFRLAYSRMAKDQLWAGLVNYAEARSNRVITNLFGIGDMAENIAYVGGRMAVQGKGPDYMWHVFRKVLARYE